MITSTPRIATILLACASLVMASCTGDQGGTGEIDTMAVDTAGADEAEARGAIARTALRSTSDQGDSLGYVSFTEVGQGINVQAEVSGLSEGMHGFHVHENGSCANEGEAAGGHFNPNDNPHGAPTDPDTAHHVGDLGNLQVSGDGTAQMDTTVQFLSLSGTSSIIGKAAIVHQGRDDLTSQPSGDSGARVACGVIQMQGAQGGNALEDTVGTAPGSLPDEGGMQ